jgi:hypothetical protein
MFLFVIYYSLILCFMKLKVNIKIGSTVLYDVNLTVIYFFYKKLKILHFQKRHRLPFLIFYFLIILLKNLNIFIYLLI